MGSDATSDVHAEVHNIPDFGVDHFAKLVLQKDASGARYGAEGFFAVVAAVTSNNSRTILGEKEVYFDVK